MDTVVTDTTELEDDENNDIKQNKEVYFFICFHL